MAQIHPITLPKWGLEMTEGTIAGWHLEEGASAAKGADLVDIETAKIVNTLDLEVAGTLRRRLAPVGTTLPIGALIAVLAPQSVSDAEIDAFVAGYKPIDASFDGPGEAAPTAPSPVVAPSPEPEIATLSAEELQRRNDAAHATPIARRLADQLGIDLGTVTGSGRGGRISQADVEAAAAKLGKSMPASTAQAAPAPTPAADQPAPQTAAASPLAGPAARRLADELSVDLAQVPATGGRGRISKEDVRTFSETRAQSPSPAATANGAGTATDNGYELIVPTAMRRAISQALVSAKQTIPHFYTSMDVTVDEALALRQRLNARPGTAKISINDFVLRAAALALAEEPDMNVHVVEEGVKRFRRADIAIAVAIEGGLITPVLRDVGALSLPQIAATAATLADRARQRTLKSEDLQGATFTVSNLGMYGVRQFEAIVNPPQGAILAVGGTRREARELDGGGIAFASVMTVTLSCDHRAIDGALAARFLAAFRRLVEDPLALVL